MTSTAAQLQYRIGMVARLTGITVHTLRVWERRYGVVAPDRTAGGDRLYTADDVARLQRVAELIKRGHAVSRVARLSDAELAALHGTSEIAEPKGFERDALIEQVLDAVVALDHRRAERILGRALIGLEPIAFISEVVEPLLVTVGRRWVAGELEVYHEHMLANVVRGMLVALMRSLAPPNGARTIVVATPRGERHEFGAMTVAILASSHGWAPTYLGIDLPAADVVNAARESRAELVSLSVTYANDPSIQAEISEIEERLEPSTLLLVGGGAARKLDYARAEVVDTTTLLRHLI